MNPNATTDKVKIVPEGLHFPYISLLMKETTSGLSMGFEGFTRMARVSLRTEYRGKDETATFWTLHMRPAAVPKKDYFDTTFLDMERFYRTFFEAVQDLPAALKEFDESLVRFAATIIAESKAPDEG